MADRLETRDGVKLITTPAKEWETVRIDPDPPLVYLVLDRPDRSNAVNTQLARELKEAVEYINHIPWEDDEFRRHADRYIDETKIIILKGEGRDFSAGGDIQEDGMTAFYADTRQDHRRAWLRTMYSAEYALWDSRKPTIAQVSGYCVALGICLAMACDMVVAEEQAVLGQPETHALGFVPNHAHWPITIGEQWSKYLLMSGESIRGSKAEEIGMILKSVPGDELESRVKDIGERLAENQMGMLTFAKHMVNDAYRAMGWDAAREMGFNYDQLGSITGMERLTKAMEEGGSSKSGWEEAHAPVIKYEDEDDVSEISK